MALLTHLCTLDVSKAFDKMNHHGLFIKLMNRLLPLTLLSALEDCLVAVILLLNELIQRLFDLN